MSIERVFDKDESQGLLESGLIDGFFASTAYQAENFLRI
jgi:hypothetical protein